MGRYLEWIWVDGQLKRIHRNRVIGLARLTSKVQAPHTLDAWVRPLNDNAQPVELTNFDSLYERWVANLLPTLRDSTRQFCHNTAKTNILPYFRNKLLSDITPLDMQTFHTRFSSLIPTRRSRGLVQRSLAP